MRLRADDFATTGNAVDDQQLDVTHKRMVGSQQAEEFCEAGGSTK
jgi:hypothetical protein